MENFNFVCYSVYERRDMGIDPLIARFSSEQEANKCSNKLDGYGGRVEREVVEIKVYKTYEEYKEDKKPGLVKSALSKLTKQEKIALGIEK